MDIGNRFAFLAGVSGNDETLQIVGALNDLQTFTISEYEQIERFMYAFCALFGLIAGILLISILARGFK